MQRRMCFTELARAELRPHADTFGPFALQFRIEQLRKLGALPVIYVPDRTSETPALDWAGVSLLARIADAAQVIGNLVDTQNLQGATLVANLTLREGGAHSRAFDERETAAIRDYVTLIQGAPGQRLSEIVGALRALASMFYPTENLQYTDLLGYYRQREWRLFSGPQIAGKPTTSLATDEQRQELLQIDPVFFAKTLPYPEGEASLASKSHFMRQVGDAHVLSTMNQLVVPSAAYDDSVGILAEHGLAISVVRLEDLPEA
ncbi:MAG: hypothetical protein Q7R30_05310 [Acidobacteriota bacterium]|nr:hypothetical protein [Acidobacteriota bacterium]